MQVIVNWVNAKTSRFLPLAFKTGTLHIITMQTFSSPPIYELGPEFYDEVTPASFPKAILRYRNQAAAQKLRLDQMTDVQWQNHFWSFQPLPGNISSPLALRYHGHQFQNYNPQLGDGRGFLFAQFQADDKLYDLGTKGSGTTPYSRRGDGRLTLKGAFREILATELLESYGVNTSKTFSVFETGDSLERHDEPSPTRAAVLVRMNHSHIRYGTFQRLAYLNQTENLKKLLNYCVRHYYPSLQHFQGQELASAFLGEVAQAAAATTAGWMSAGFVHGVLNTDNMNITGESFDYGPYRFLPYYDPAFTAAYFDYQGLYCFGRQPASVLWNLHQLGIALQTCYPELPREEVLETFSDIFNIKFHQCLLTRLNLKNPLQDPAGAYELNINLVSALFSFLASEKCPYEQTLFDIHSGALQDRLQRSPQKEIYAKDTFKNLRHILDCFETASSDKQGHPYFQQPQACSLIIDELENLWTPVAERDDWGPFERKLEQIRSFRGVYT